MGGVEISPNLKKNSQRLMPDGRIMDVKSRQVVDTTIEQAYVPTPEELAHAMNKPAPTVEKSEPAQVPEGKAPNPLGEIIKKQVQEQVAKTLKEIDIASMVKQAVEEAFK